MEAVLALPAHIMALQEVRLGAVAQQHIENQLRSRGWQTFWGKPQPLREGQHYLLGMPCLVVLVF